MENNTYVVRAEGGKFSQIFRENGFTGLGWFSGDSALTFDLSKSSSRAYVKEKILENHKNLSSVGLGLSTGMCYRFINEVKIGDKILSPTHGNKVMIGTVVSDCYVEIDNLYDGILRRKIEWGEDVDKEILSEEIKRKLYCNLTFFSVDEELIYDITEESDKNVVDTTEIENVYSGYTYFMKSQTIPNVYKIGKADDYNVRERDLLKDNRYGLFSLKTLGWVKVKEPYKLEKLFHTYYQEFRLSRKNGLEVDTELFITENNLYDMWKKFIKTNYLDDDVMKKEILEYNFS